MEKLIQYRTKASLYDGAFDSKVGWAAAGMGYLIVTQHGQLIVVDGGNAEDGEDFLALIESYADGKPVIEKWIITHPHGDHYGALLSIAKNPELAARIEVRELVYHFPEDFRDRRGNGIGYVYPDFEKIHSVTGAVHHLPAVGETLTVDGMTIHMLYTPTDVTILDNPNQLSLIFTVQGGGRKILFTGDAYHRTMQIAVWRYGHGDTLKSDILQLPHHGLCDTGNMEFYKKADAKCVLIPISIAGDRTMRSDMYGDSPAVNRWAEDNADTVHKAFEGTVEIAL